MAKKTSHVNWRSWPTIFGYQDGIMIICMSSIVCFAVMLAGCSSSRAHMPNIYVLSASYTGLDVHPSQNSTSSFTTFLSNFTQDARMDLRIGFFGPCFRFPTAIEGQASWICTDPSTISQLSDTRDKDPLQLLEVASGLSKRVFFYGLFLAAIALQTLTIVGLARFPRWHDSIDENGDEEQIRPFPPPTLLKTCIGTLLLAVLCGGASIMWTHVGAVSYADALDQMFRGYVKGSVGTAAIALGWIGTGLNAFALFMLLHQDAGIRVLKETGRAE